MSARFPNPGEVFEETYRIETILGSGGFARVYRAVELALERPVALKILRPPLNTSQTDSQRDTYMETLMERFQREAMMLSRLRSPYTVNLYKYGKTEDGLLYMALEYIDGLSLAEILRPGKPLEPARAVKIIKQVLLSLQEAHTLGMLHRDLKPANVMVYDHLGEKDKVKLLDFGIAKLVRDAPTGQQDLTSDGTLIGTPRYMAPEQIQGEAIGPPADIYALGLVAYELLTGERAIKGESSIQIIGRQLAPQSFKLPITLVAPPALRSVINKMIAKNISDRFQTCEEVVAALSAPSILDDELDETELDISSLVVALDADGEIETMDSEAILPLLDDDVFAEEPEPIQRSRTPLIIAGVVALIFGAVVVAVFAGEGGEEVDAEPVALQKEETVEPPPAPEEQLEFEEAQVTIAAKLGGEALEGASVLISGVEKGFTPMTIEASAVKDSQIVIRYQPPGAAEALEEAQEVTTPRDVLVEFNPVVVVAPAPVEAEEPERAAAPVKPSPTRAAKAPPAPKPKKKPSIYETLVPE